MNDIQTIIACESLCKTFADGKLYAEVLKNINLQIKTGEMVAVVGASGEGKSTLLHLLGGLDFPTSGSVTVCRQELAKLSEKEKGRLRNKYLGFVYQFHHLLPEFNALENVAMPLLIGGINYRRAKQQATDLLDKVGLAKRHLHRVGELSGGERQRVAIARALVTKPACVLADEPTGNLDHKHAEQIFAIIKELNAEFGIAFLIVTHDLQLASQMPRKLILENGTFK